MNTIDLIEDERPEGSDGNDQMGHLVTGELDLSHGVALYLEDITVSFDGFRALNKLNLTIDAGELRCIIGPNGAGKTTMMDVITGKTRPTRARPFRPDHRPDPPDRTRDRPRRHRPQVPEAHHLRAAHGVREPRAGDEDRQARLEKPVRLAGWRRAGPHCRNLR
jgi:hypothetical protein